MVFDSGLICGLFRDTLVKMRHLRMALVIGLLVFEPLADSAKSKSTGACDRLHRVSRRLRTGFRPEHS